ncbi:MAG: hypothetical protein IPH18_14640 [Chitinophagaceae bacterium]|nr:hypothetical protein [Chitinophagaceae bacterium]
MKKTIIFLAFAALITEGLKAQTIHEGYYHILAQRFQSAIGVFEKMIAQNPNNTEAIYWLGHTYHHMDEDGNYNTKARLLYQKALETNGSSPFILVGLGHADLLDNKTNDARQKFEAALMASRGKKGNDPTILSLIGQANVEAKAGDANYAVQLLEEAIAKDDRNLNAHFQAANAYRKANPGNNGGRAYQEYKKCMEIDQSFAPAAYKLAKLFETQRSWDLYLENLAEAVKRDAKFAPAYYELFYYNFFRQKYPEAEESLNKFINNTDESHRNDFLYAQLCWAKKDFDCAVAKGEAAVADAGVSGKAKMHKLLADAYFQKGDYTNALKNIDLYFQKAQSGEVIAFDYKLKADILVKMNAVPADIVNAYKEGADADTVLNSKIDLLKQGLAYFFENKMKDMEVLLREKLISVKLAPSINDYFDLMKIYYDIDNNTKSREVSLLMAEKFSDQVYGYEWAFRNAAIMDTVKVDSIAVPDAMKLYEFAQKDTVKFRNQYISAVRFMGGYYVNNAKNKQKALEFFGKWRSIDTANAEKIDAILKQVEKMQPPKPPVTPKAGAKTPPAKPVATKPKPKTKTSSLVKK